MAPIINGLAASPNKCDNNICIEVANALLFGKVTESNISETTAQFVLRAVIEKNSNIQLNHVILLAHNKPKNVIGTAIKTPIAQTSGSARPSIFLKYCAAPEPKLTPTNPAIHIIPPKIVVALIIMF